MENGKLKMENSPHSPGNGCPFIRIDKWKIHNGKLKISRIRPAMGVRSHELKMENS